MLSKFLLFVSVSIFLINCETTSKRSTASIGEKKPFVFLPGFSKPFPRAAPPANLAPGIGLRPDPGMRKNSDVFSSQMNESIFNEVSTFSEGFIKGAVVKFLIDRRREPAQIYFINGNFVDERGVRPEYVQYHFYFAQHQLGIPNDGDDFNKHTYFTNDLAQKHFVAGTIQKYEVLQGTEKKPFYGIQFYPQDLISEQTLLTAVGIVKDKIDFADVPVKVISSGAQQSFKEVSSALLNMNVTPTSIDQIYAGVSFVAMHKGETYGNIRYKPSAQQLDELLPTDIPVFEELPLDLSVVSGVITTIIQDAGSHINLKSKERNTPNMVLRDPGQIEKLKAFDGKPVKLSVMDDTFSIEKSTAKVVNDFYNKKLQAKPWTKIENGKLTDMNTFDQMAAKLSPSQLIKSANSYGGKASKLAFLASSKIAGIGSEIQKSLGYRLTPLGFAIPVKAYLDFVQSNPKLSVKIQSLAAAERGLKGAKPLTSVARIALINEIQAEFLKTPMPEQIVQKISEQIQNLKIENQKNYPNSTVKKVKVRSSANAEDIKDFDGAGLHSSYSAKIEQLGTASDACTIQTSSEGGVVTKEEMAPETVICAVKGVFASLWNKRAVEERSFAHIDQSTAAMGIAVNNSYDFRKKTEDIKEIANAVLVTRIINAKGVYGYRLSVNTDENLVTNPTPGTQAEVVLATFLELNEKPQLSYLQYAKTDAVIEVLNHPLLAPDVYMKMVKIAQNIEYNYCRSISTYYPGGDCSYVYSDLEKPSSLDMEFKIYSNGEVLLKQTREFSGK